MTDVSVLGLGAMGAALANAFVTAGHDVTVWNRSAARLDPWRDGTANCAVSVDAAIDASPVTVVCIDDYAATRVLLASDGVDAALAGRTLVQFSTGTPAEARELEAFASGRGARYLDGAILAYPRDVGHDALIAVAGEASTYDTTAPLLAALSTDLRYLGTAIGAAAALDVAILSYYVCTHLGLVHAALVCESERVSPALLAGVIADSLPSDVSEIRHLGDALERQSFGEPGASIDVYSGVLDRILAQAGDAGIDDRIPAFANELYKRGVAEGLGGEEVVALVKLLRNNNGGKT